MNFDRTVLYVRNRAARAAVLLCSAAPGGFSDHERGEVFGFDLAHIVFDTALMAGIHPYLVFDILEGML